MHRSALAVLLAMCLAACTSVAPTRTTPAADHHQHILSPAMADFFGSQAMKPLLAKDVVAALDEAGIDKAVLLSIAYTFGRPTRVVADEYAKVREENDWTAAQAALYPNRLIAFCGVNPLKDYAVQEITRCAADRRTRRGIKLHFGNSDVQLESPQHSAKVAEVFRTANQHRMAIVVHLRASISQKRPYGAVQGRAFIEQVLPAAPDVTVQVAHLAGSGPGYDDPPAQEVMQVLADAIQRGDPRTRNLVFDFASNAGGDNPPETTALIVRLIRQVGVDRFFYGSDAALGGNPKAREQWAAFRRLPLTQEESAHIAANVAPYLR